MTGSPQNVARAAGGRRRGWFRGAAGALGLVLGGGWAMGAEVAVPSNLSWRSVDHGRIAAVQPAPSGRSGFTRLPAERTGITFTNLLPEPRHLTNQILPNGSGVAAGDVDQDGRCDLFFCGLKDSGSRLYRNLGGWRFEDVTATAGVGQAGWDSTGAAFADLDGDGDLDLVVNSIGGGTHLYFNDGQGRFTRAPLPLNPGRGGTSIGLADADGDGDLDLYLTNYRQATITDAPGTRFGVKMIQGQPVVTLVNGRPLTDPEWTNRFRFKFELGPGGRGTFGHEELGEPDAFFLNDGAGGFTPVPFTDGRFLDEAGQPLRQPFFDWGLSVLFRDLNGDGAPDLYLCNDFSTPDRLWLNEGQGRFRLAPALALRQTSLASMAVDAADLDRDGHDDLVVLDMLSREHERRLTQRNIMRAELAPADAIEGRPQYPRNTVFRNRGDGTYAEIAQYAGLEGTEWSWNPVLLDVDLDGFEDLLVPNGFVRDNMNLDALNRIAAEKVGRRFTALEELHLRSRFPPLNTPNLAFRNLGQWRFAECSQAWGFAQPTLSQGACLADLDNDGDLDLVVNNLNSVAGVYRNDTDAPRVAIRLRGQPPNTAGIGARLTVSGGPLVQSQEIVAGGRYVSSDQAQRTFAAGTANTLQIRVRWRAGHDTLLHQVPANHLVEVFEPPTQPQPSTPPAPPPSPTPRHEPSIRFEDVSDRLGHVHEDPLFNDDDRQPLLPRKLSQLGPGVAWWDLHGDGRDDLIAGSGRGGRLGLWRNLGQGRFARHTAAPWDGMVERDTAGLAGLIPGSLLLAWSNYEDGATNAPGIAELTRTRWTARLPLAAPSYGPLAVADYDGDGALDLFVGARATGGRYPEPGASALYRRQGTGWVLDATNTRALPPGLVSGALWADLTGDGWPDLVLACDWGPLRIFRNQQGRLHPWDPAVQLPPDHRLPPSSPGPSPAAAVPPTLATLTGWWNGVAAGDFDNDGRLDLVASNWGANTPYERWRPGPVQMHYGDFSLDGTLALLEGHYVAERRQMAPHRMLDAVTRSLPRLAGRFPTHEAWSQASLASVLGEEQPQARHVEAVWLESTLFLNRGDTLEVRLLPPEAQFAPAFAVVVGDADGDGHEDLFLSQNFFGVNLDTSRYDAGRGLWLRGDGRGGLAPVPGQEAGIRVYGEQRGAALADFDGDGRPDLVVTQNRADTKLYRNVGAQPGLRVRLQGAEGNPCGIGAVLRLRFGTERGPARALHAGSGYWSQNSPVQVLATPAPPTAIEVRWPGGRVTESPIPAGAQEIQVQPRGELPARPP